MNNYRATKSFSLASTWHSTRVKNESVVFQTGVIHSFLTSAPGLFGFVQESQNSLDAHFLLHRPETEEYVFCVLSAFFQAFHQ